MATVAPSEPVSLRSRAHRENDVDVFTCEDMSDDWDGFALRQEALPQCSKAVPVSVSRCVEITCDRLTRIIVSRSASIDEAGRVLHEHDPRAQIRRAFVNIFAQLEAAGAAWSDVVRVTCFRRALAEGDALFKEELEAFCHSQALGFCPYSRLVEAVLARDEMLVEVEAVAVAVVKR